MAQDRAQFQQEIDKLTEETDKLIKEQAGRLNSFTGREWLEREIEEVPELVNNWVRIGDLTILVGFSGVGKSTIALPLALSLTSGVPFLGCEVPNPEPVLYLDLEMGEYEFGTRIQTLLPQFPDIARDNFHAISIPSKQRTSFKVNIDRDRFQLLNELEAIRPKLLVIDNHARFHSGDSILERDMISMIVTPFSDWMAKFELAILYVMHTGWKERERPRGSVAILDAAPTMIAMVKGRDPRNRILRWEKNRPVRRQQGPSRLSTWYDPDTFMVEAGETGGIADVDEIIQVTTFPVERKSFTEQLQSELGIGRSRSYGIVRDLVKEGKLVADGDMLYSSLGPIEL